MKKIFYYIVLFLSFINISFANNNLTIDVDNKESKKINISLEKIDYLDENNSNSNIISKIIDTIKILYPIPIN